LKRNDFGRSYVRISEGRVGHDSISIPVSGLAEVIAALTGALQASRRAEANNTATTATTATTTADTYTAPAPTAAAVEASARSVFIGGFPKDAIDSYIAAYMSRVGKVRSVTMKGGKGRAVISSAVVEV
jgi:hypothetical protein